MFNAIEIGSYLTKLIWFGWVTHYHMRLETIVTRNIYDIFIN